MQARLLTVTAVTAVVYSVWSGLGVWFATAPGVPSVLANTLIGVLLGVLFTFLNEGERLRLTDFALQVVIGAVMFGVFAVFGVRGFVREVMVAWALRGALFGGAMWLLGGVHHYIGGGANWQRVLGVLVAVGGLVIAPELAARFFDGALFVVAAVGARILADVTITRLPLDQQAFIFGTAVGIAAVAVPGIGYFAYGAF